MVLWYGKLSNKIFDRLGAFFRLKLLVAILYEGNILTNYRYTAIIATVSNAFCDTVLDYTVGFYNYYKVLLLTSMIAFIGQIGIGLYSGIAFSLSALPYVFIHAVLILCGYICFVRALKYLPVALVGLVESSSLFLTFAIDAVLGYVVVSFSFILLLALFVFSIFLFTENCVQDKQNCIKIIRPIGFVWVFASVLFYLVAPYLVKVSSFKGANEIAINLGYYFFAILYFWFQLHFIKIKQNSTEQYSVRWWQNIYPLSLIIGFLEAVYYVFETFSFINDTPTVVVVIEQTRLFLLFIFSIFLKRDKFSWKKLVALMLGGLSAVGIYFY